MEEEGYDNAGLLRSQRKYARNKKTYFNSIAELRSKRRDFFRPEPKIFLGKRLIAGAFSEYGAVECVIRFGVSYPKPYKSILAATLLKLNEEFGSHGHSYEVPPHNHFLKKIVVS